MNYRKSPFGGTPPVVKNLIIINALMLLGYYAFSGAINLNWTLGLFYWGSDQFEPYQIITHMFMHGNFAHLFFNMFALWMFGRVLENVWGPKRFFIYYFVTGLGAAFLHLMVNHIQIQSLMAQMPQEQINEVMARGFSALQNNQNFTDPNMAKLNLSINIPTVGASGAVFGILLAFGMLFPNTQLLLLFPPIPIKAKYFVMGYGVIELFLGISQPGSNVAHFAHVGGMLFGFILIKYWNSRKGSFY
ncbi:MAG: rhomboid family intramembrane serine protease [Bacteroidales bacterium]|nr:rhomboid family intramembrane serine protease [Bacteroidales bacterium]MBS3773835.1 rhomboid family intramembrane serine protease [Bacteroidales bacterium]